VKKIVLKMAGEFKSHVALQLDWVSVGEQSLPCGEELQIDRRCVSHTIVGKATDVPIQMPAAARRLGRMQYLPRIHVFFVGKNIL
jgi:hypothetical protein